MDLTSRPPPADWIGYHGLWLFEQGRARVVRLEISGTYDSRPFTTFEYRYTTGGSRTTYRHIQAVMIWEQPDAALPDFTLMPEGVGNRVAQVFGATDVDFPGDPIFSRGYFLTGPNESAISDRFTTEVREFLTADPRQHIGGSRDRLIWWVEGPLPPPDRQDAFLESGAQIGSLFLPQP